MIVTAARAWIVFALLGAGCAAPPATAHACVCAYLTDTDDEGTVPELVCAASPERAAAVAKGCAARVAPAPVTTCACTPAPSVVACRTGECLPPLRRD